MIELWLINLFSNNPSGDMALMALCHAIWVVIMLPMWTLCNGERIKDPYTKLTIFGFFFSVFRLLFPLTIIGFVVYAWLFRAITSMYTDRFSKIFEEVNDGLVSLCWVKKDAVLTDTRTMKSAVSPIRYSSVMGTDLNDMRDHIRKRELHQHGDVILVWVNEGDLLNAEMNGVVEKIT